MNYCSSCGEPVEGRFCRMCGAAYPAPGGEVPGQQADQTQMIAYTAAAPHSAQAPQPDSTFDSLFRRAPGESNPHNHTQLLPPVEADYRMAAPQAPGHGSGSSPAGAANQPGYDGRPGDPWPDAQERPESRRPVILGTLGAVAAATAVILGLLYVGGRSDSNAAATAGGGTSAGAQAQNSIGAVVLPSGSAIPSASASASASAGASVSTMANSTLPLGPGSTGQLVLWVQERLHQLNYYHGPFNSQFDQATAQAVVNFQGAAQVTGDPAATVGRSTYTALVAAGTRPNLKPGGKADNDVKRLQAALNAAEGARLTVSGRYDAATAAAVWRYQSAVNVMPTGFMNGQTWAKLQSGTVV